MLTLTPARPEPFRTDAGRAEMLTIWDGLDQEGRRMILANARAVAEQRGRVPLPSGPTSVGPKAA
jgi:hypothetical protein